MFSINNIIKREESSIINHIANARRALNFPRMSIPINARDSFLKRDVPTPPAFSPHSCTTMAPTGPRTCGVCYFVPDTCVCGFERLGGGYDERIRVFVGECALTKG